MSNINITARRWQHGWELFAGDEILTQSTTLADAAQEVRDYLATERGGEPEDYDVTVRADLDGVEDEVARTAARIHEVQEESADLAVRWRVLAAVLRTDCGLSVRDTAAVMDVSPGRVSQLVDAGRREKVLVTEVGPAPRSDDDGVVVDLLDALQRSVDRAKASRGEREEKRPGLGKGGPLLDLKSDVKSPAKTSRAH